MTILTSTIFIVNDVELYTNEIISNMPLHSCRVIKNAEEDKDTFLIAQSKAAIREAYISVSETKYIILSAARFSVDAQNSLLKVLEEPPKNILLLIVTNSKTTILPTIFSRLSYQYLKMKKNIVECTLDIENIDLKSMYEFLKENQRITRLDLKDLIESIMYQINDKKIKLNKVQLESFATAMKLCDLNSRPINVLNTLLLNLLDKTK